MIVMQGGLVEGSTIDLTPGGEYVEATFRRCDVRRDNDDNHLSLDRVHWDDCRFLGDAWPPEIFEILDKDRRIKPGTHAIPDISRPARSSASADTARTGRPRPRSSG